MAVYVLSHWPLSPSASLDNMTNHVPTHTRSAHEQLMCINASAGPRRVVAQVAAVDTATSKTKNEDVVLGEGVMLSGLNGKALEGGKYWPTKKEVFDAIPEHLLKRDTGKSMLYAASSLAITAACFAAGTAIPAEVIWAAAWIVYAAVTGVTLSDDSAVRHCDSCALRVHQSTLQTMFSTP